jgi:hypothetical protein
LRARQSRILIYLKISGLGLFNKELALRFAEQGITHRPSDRLLWSLSRREPEGRELSGREHAAQLQLHLPGFF